MNAIPNRFHLPCILPDALCLEWKTLKNTLCQNMTQLSSLDECIILDVCSIARTRDQIHLIIAYPHCHFVFTVHQFLPLKSAISDSYYSLFGTLPGTNMLNHYPLYSCLLFDTNRTTTIPWAGTDVSVNQPQRELINIWGCHASFEPGIVNNIFEENFWGQWMN